MTHSPLATLNDQDRPREKMLAQGSTHLTDVELLTLLIGTGTSKESAFELATRLFQDREQSWFEIGRLSILQLQAYPGIGEAKAVVIRAALEIARRRLTAPVPELIRVTSSIDAFEACRHQMEDLHVEQLRVLLLNRGNQIVRQEVLTTGSQSGTIADPKLIFQMALEHRASSFILVHNHPSGNITPSVADDRVTECVLKSGEMLDLPLMDHLIIGHGHYYSFADEGKI